MESQKDITTWESFRAKTKPFLQNLKKGKMLSKRKEGKKRHLLDQRMSVSEPDMVQVGKTYSESCSRVIVKTSAINYFSSPSTPVKKRDQVMVPQISVSPGHPQKPENSCPEKEACTPTTLPELVKESSSNSAEDLVERSFYLGTDDKYADDLSESTDLESSQSSQFLEQSFEHEEPGREPSACGLPSYLLTIQLKEGRNLVIRDRCGTSDPYVKFKLAGKTLYKSKIMYKNLNPRWDETFVIPVKNLNQKLYVKVYDRDLATDDFMGSAYLSLSELEVNSTVLKQLQLDDPNSLEEDMGEIILEIKLANKPRDGIRNAGPVRKKRGTQTKTSLIQNIRLSDTLRKSQLWDSIVTITLFEGKGFREDAAEGCYVKFRLGEEKYKSKVLYKCTNPQWRERFDFHLFNDRASILEVEVCGKVNQKQEASFGMCKVNLLTFSKGQANCKELSLENGQGSVVLLITIRTCNGVYISDPCVSPLHDETERQQIIQRYCLRNTFQDISDIGFLQVQVVKASNLAAADFAGKSDPFCVLELGNDKLQTHTVYKNLNPAWNKVFSFNIRDIHDVLEVTVFDEDGDKPPDFLGKVAIPLLSIKNGQETAYFLKNRKLGRPEKGVLYLQMDIIYNPIKASIRTFKPKEPRNQEENAKFSRKTLTRNVRRVRNITRAIWNTLQFIQSCFEWHSPQRSLIAFLLYLVIVWTFEIYMIPLAFLLLFAWNYIQKARGKVVSQHYMEDYDVDIDDDDEEDEKVTDNVSNYFSTSRHVVCG